MTEFNEGAVMGVAKVHKPLRVKIIQLTFKSDHALLKNWSTDWEDNGTQYTKPDWTPSRANPVSHTMNQEVRIELTLEMGPADADTGLGTGELVGKGPHNLEFRKSLSLKPGTVTVQLTSSRKLPKILEALKFKILWNIEHSSTAVMPRTTTNDMFVTMGTPTCPSGRNWSASAITLKRMRHAIDVTARAPAPPEPHKLVYSILQRWSTFNLNIIYWNEWELANRPADGADCQTIVRYVESIKDMVGCPGVSEFVVVWAKVPTPTIGESNPAYSPHVMEPPQFYNNFVRTPDPTKSDWAAILVDGNGGYNNYEACLKFSYGGVMKYYAGGVDRFDNSNEVIRVFTTMSWIKIVMQLGEWRAVSRTPVGTIYRYRP